MLNPKKAMSTKEYETRLQLVIDLQAELAAALRALEAEKAKSKILRKRLRDQRSRHQIALVATEARCNQKADERLEAVTRETERRVDELRRIQDKTKRENEHLRLASQPASKVRGNLENIKERVSENVFFRIMAGGSAGSI